MSKARPLFELEKDFDEKELLMQKLTQNFDDGSMVKRECPAVDGSSIEALFYGVEEFGEACKGLQWDAFEELSDGFRLILRGTARERWDMTVGSIPEADELNQARFQTAINDWLLTFFDGDARQTQMTFIEHLKKPRSMEVRAFSERIGTMISRAKKIPPINEDVTITDAKRKTITFEAMPFPWRNEFQAAGKKLNEESMQDMVQYMVNAKERQDDRETRGGRGRGRGKGRNGNGG